MYFKFSGSNQECSPFSCFSTHNGQPPSSFNEWIKHMENNEKVTKGQYMGSDYLCRNERNRKRYTNAYGYFFRDLKSKGDVLPFAELSKKASSLWKSLDVSQRKQYKDRVMKTVKNKTKNKKINKK